MPGTKVIAHFLTKCIKNYYFQFVYFLIVLHLFKYENINLLIKLMLAYSSSNGLVFIKKYCNFITKTKLSKHSKKLVT